MICKKLISSLGVLALVSCSHSTPTPQTHVEFDSRIKNPTRIPLEGATRRAHFSSNSDSIYYEKTKNYGTCPQIWQSDLEGKNAHLVILPPGQSMHPSASHDGKKLYFDSTRASGESCSDEITELSPFTQIYEFDLKRKVMMVIEPGTSTHYNGEWSVCGSQGVWTSFRDQDLEIYAASLNSFGTLDHIRRLTHSPGEDSAPTFSPLCDRIVWVSEKLESESKIKTYQKAISEDGHYVPSRSRLMISTVKEFNPIELQQEFTWVADPVFTPDGNHIVFSGLMSSNQQSKWGLYLIEAKVGSKPTSLTSGLHNYRHPQFSHDGRKLLFSTDRFTKEDAWQIVVSDWIN